MLVLRDEDKEEYEMFMDLTACSVYKNSIAGLSELKKIHTEEEIIANDTDALGDAVGQIVLDRVIDLTKDMSREQMIRFLAQSSTQYLLVHMRRNEQYLNKITFLSHFL